MYFPYFRGKREEVLAVAEAAFLSDVVLPVFEPTSLSTARINQFARIGERDGRFAFIVNSDHGKPPPSFKKGLEVVDSFAERIPEAVFPAFEIRANSRSEDVREFSERCGDRRCVIVHRNVTLSGDDLRGALAPLRIDPVHILREGGVPRSLVKSLSSVGIVLLRDGFDRQQTNREYPKRSNFDDLLYNYQKLGYDGFADFTITGDWYFVGGGPAKHVALHVTECAESTMVTRHFVSRTPPVKGDLAAKYFSALDQLVVDAGDPPTKDFDTQGIRNYLASHQDRHFPGLGMPKRWSMLHHMEIIDRQLRQEKAIAFI